MSPRFSCGCEELPSIPWLRLTKLWVCARRCYIPHTACCCWICWMFSFQIRFQLFAIYILLLRFFFFFVGGGMEIDDLLRAG